MIFSAQRIQAEMAHSDSDSHASSFDEEDDQDWGDWVEDNGEGAELRIASSSSGDGARTVYHALFCDPDSAGSLRAFASADEAIDHAAGLGCDLLDIIRRCKLDTLQTIRLINHVRRQASTAGKRPDPVAYNALTGDEPFLHDDAELVPVPGYENDGLLQTDFDEMSAPGDDGNVSQSRRVAELESQLHASQLAFDDLRRRFMNDSDLGESLRATKTAMGSREKMDVGAGNTGEDSHYFTSYASHDIHQTMISDKVRTLSIRGKTIMDVGCGSGILSLFAARAGAKKVVAIDASDVASRARENIRANGLDSVITVYKGKVEELGEELSEYKGKVDVIVSEWMVSVRWCGKARQTVSDVGLCRGTFSSTNLCCRLSSMRATSICAKAVCWRRHTQGCCWPPWQTATSSLSGSNSGTACTASPCKP